MQAGPGATSGREVDLRDQIHGYRCIAVKREREVTLFSRHKKVLNKRFPRVVEALASLGDDFLPDGELVALDSQGRPSFQLLQNTRSRTLLVYFSAFDLLNRDGELLVNLEIEHRRDLLGSMIAAPEDPLRLSPLLQAPPEQVLEAVRKLGLEGVIGKRMNSVYEPGERSGAWIKHRTNLEQEFVIGGYIPGARGFGADGRVAPGSRLCSQRTLSSRSLASDPGGEEPGTHACKGKNSCKGKGGCATDCSKPQ